MIPSFRPREVSLFKEQIDTTYSYDIYQLYAWIWFESDSLFNY